MLQARSTLARVSARVRPAPAPARAAPVLVPAVTRALTLLDRLAQQREPMTLARLAAELALPKSSVHGLCSTLVTFGYLQRQGDGSFLIGPRVMGLAEAFVAGTDVAQEFNALWKDVGAAPDETFVLSVLSGTDVVYVGVRNGARPLSLAFNVGMRLPAHLAATGKAMLAHQSPEVVRRLYAGRTLQRMAGGGAATLGELAKELAQVRERGYSVDDASIRQGVYCVAAPVFDAAGQAVAGVGVCSHKTARGAAGRGRGGDHRDAVREVARLLSQRIGAPSPSPAVAPPARRAPAKRVRA